MSRVAASQSSLCNGRKNPASTMGDVGWQPGLQSRSSPGVGGPADPDMLCAPKSDHGVTMPVNMVYDKIPTRLVIAFFYFPICLSSILHQQNSYYRMNAKHSTHVSYLQSAQSPKHHQ